MGWHECRHGNAVPIAGEQYFILVHNGILSAVNMRLSITRTFCFAWRIAFLALSLLLMCSCTLAPLSLFDACIFPFQFEVVDGVVSLHGGKDLHALRQALPVVDNETGAR